MTLEQIYSSEYEYTDSLRRRACFGLRIYQEDGQTIVVMSDLPGNKGPSITNSVEGLATEIRREFGLDPDQTRWIEHWEQREWQAHGRAKVEPLTYDEVFFKWEDYQAVDVEWRRLDREETEAWLET